MRVNVQIATLVALLCSGSAAVAAEAASCSFAHAEVMTALSNPAVPLKEYHDFFDKVHIPEIVQRGIGFESGQRFRVVASLGAAPWEYLSLYGLEQANQVAQMGMKFRPGPQPVAAPAPYLAEGSVAWIFRRVTAAGDNAGRRVECGAGQKLFVVIPKAGGAEADVAAALSSLPDLTSVERFEFRKSTKGPEPAWRGMAVLRSSAGVNVQATLERLGSLVGCANGACAESSGAVWVLEPLSDLLARRSP